MRDPIRELYRLFSLAKRPSFPAAERDQLTTLDQQVKGLRNAGSEQWLAYYQDVEQVAASAHSALNGSANKAGRPRLDSATRRMVDSFLRQSHDAVRGARDLWLGRIDRQRNYLNEQAKTQADDLKTEETATKGTLKATFSNAEVATWERWLNSATDAWTQQLSAGVRAEIDKRIQTALEPAKSKLPTGFLKAPPETEPGEIRRTDFALKQRELSAKLLSTWQMFGRSLKSSFFTISMVAGMAITVGGAVLGLMGGAETEGGAPTVSGHAPEVKKSDAKGYLFLGLLPLLAFFAWRTARAAGAKDREEKTEKLREGVRRELLRESESYIKNVHSTLRSWAERYFHDADLAVNRWLVEVDYELNAMSENEQTSGGDNGRDGALAKELDDSVLTAVRARIGELQGGS